MCERHEVHYEVTRRSRSPAPRSLSPRSRSASVVPTQPNLSNIPACVRVHLYARARMPELKTFMYMKFNNNAVTAYTPTDEEIEYINSISHRHDPDRHVEGILRFYGKPDVTKLAIADSNLDFEMDLDNGVVQSDMQPNNDFQCSGEKGEEIPSSEIFGLQLVDRLGSQDKNYNPLGWSEVQKRLGLDTKFDPIPAPDDVTR